jgi:hypothetical protein
VFRETPQLEFSFNLLGGKITPAVNQGQNIVQRGTKRRISNLFNGAVVDLARPLARDAQFFARLRQQASTLPIPSENALHHLAIPSARNVLFQQPD